MKIVSITSEGLRFNNGFSLKDYHYQDCCEQVYADWESLKDQSLIFKVKFDNSIIEKCKVVPDSGINIYSTCGKRFFIPCYNIQNGWYSNDLSIKLYNKDKKIVDEKDITDATEEKDG